jgi:hypothetical protein
MSERRREGSRRLRKPPGSHSPVGSIRLTAPEGDDIILVTARYRRSVPDEIHQTLQDTGGFDLDHRAGDAASVNRRVDTGAGRLTPRTVGGTEHAGLE